MFTFSTYSQVLTCNVELLAIVKAMSSTLQSNKRVLVYYVFESSHLQTVPVRIKIDKMTFTDLYCEKCSLQFDKISIFNMHFSIVHKDMVGGYHLQDKS